MREIVVHDHVRDVGLTVVVPPDATAGRVRDSAVAAAGLPLRDFRGEDLHYDLHVGQGPPLDPGAPYPATAAATSDAHLRSSTAAVVWAEVLDRSRTLRDEVQQAVRGVAGAAEDEVRGTVRRIREAAEDEARALVREATARLEQSLLTRLRGVRRFVGPGRGQRRRIAEQVEALRATGALRNETRAASLAVGQLTTLTSAAVAVPIAGAAVAIAIGAAGATIAADPTTPPTDDDGTAVIATLTRQVADLERQLALHVADDTDPHGTDPVGSVAGYVVEELDDGTTPEAWVRALVDGAVLRAAERDDRALATRYVDSGVAVTVLPGETLWALAERLLGNGEVAATCGNQVDDDPPTADVARHVGALWLHNAGVVGDDPDAIEPGTRLQAVCP